MSESINLEGFDFLNLRGNKEIWEHLGKEKLFFSGTVINVCLYI